MEPMAIRAFISSREDYAYTVLVVLHTFQRLLGAYFSFVGS